MALTPKHQRFVQEYLIDRNATQAAIRAGYNATNANVTGPRLLANVGIQEAIRDGLAEAAERNKVTVDKVLRELALVAFSDIGQVMDFSGVEPRLKPANEIPETARRSISGMKVKRYMEGHGEDARQVEVTEFKLWSKDSALEKLAKHLGMFVERHEHSGPDGGDIPFGGGVFERIREYDRALAGAGDEKQEIPYLCNGNGQSVGDSEAH